MATNARSNVIFSATLYGRRNAMWEVVVCDDENVMYTHRSPGANNYRTKQLDLQWRDVSDLLWKLEDDILCKWDKQKYGSGEIGESGYWMVMLQRSRTLHKWQGYRQYPPDWDHFTFLIEETFDHPFGI